MPCYLQMSDFSSFPQFWLLRCSWERWVILLQYRCGVGDISAVHLSCWILYISVWEPDRDFAPLRKDDTPSSFRFLCSCLRYSLTDPLFASDKTRKSRFRFAFEFFIAQKSSIHSIREKGERMDGISRIGSPNSHRMQLFQSRTSTYGFLLTDILLGTTFLKQILEVFIHYYLV
jgi:hypothetical protein